MKCRMSGVGVSIALRMVLCDLGSDSISATEEVMRQWFCYDQAEAKRLEIQSWYIVLQHKRRAFQDWAAIPCVLDLEERGTLHPLCILCIALAS